MSAVVVVGAQWGDEGKAKVIDFLTEKNSYNARYQGGANAGHSFLRQLEKFVMHAFPVGIVHPGTTNMIGPKVVGDPEVIVRDELSIAKRFGSRVLIDRSAYMVTPLHKMLDRAREEHAKPGQMIGTTQRGIGPAYEDMAARRGIQFGDLTSRAKLERALDRGGFYAERAILLRSYGVAVPSSDELIEWCMQFAETLVPLLDDTRATIGRAIDLGKKVNFEGAQGIMLDLVHGSVPFVTSSQCGPSEVSASFGVYTFDKVIGVSKAYTTRVGAGPLPTELHDEMADRIRRAGDEYGATTGRPRRCGWLDLVALRYAVRMGGITDLVLTKLDILRGINPIRVCNGYTFEGREITMWDSLTTDVLEHSTPRYVEFKGWDADLSTITRWEDLPERVREFVSYIDGFTGVRRLLGVSTGPQPEHFLYKSSLRTRTRARSIL